MNKYRAWAMKGSALINGVVERKLIVADQRARMLDLRLILCMARNRKEVVLSHAIADIVPRS